MITLINYADDNMTIAQQDNKLSALKCGVDQAICYGPGNISAEYKRFNSSIWNTERGAGLWGWKSWVCYDAILELSDNDIMIYSDSGITWKNGVHEIISRMDEDIFFFTNTFKQVEWTHHKVMDTILPEWRDGRYNDRMQVQASVIFFKVNQRTRDFIKEWMLYCMMPGLIEPADKTEKDFPTYAAHREDQSILCALQIKHGYKLHWYPSTTGHHVKQHTPDDGYPELFWHNRKRNNEW